MPYSWENTATPQHRAELHLWPHQSLSAQGFSLFMLSFFALALVPFVALIGTRLMWGLLPFMLAALTGIYVAIRRNSRDRRIIEVLTLTTDRIGLERHGPGKTRHSWESNPYWTKVALHQTGGPVPFYVTLTGGGREVEIGAFLSEDERKALYGELTDRVRQMAQSS